MFLGSSICLKGGNDGPLSQSGVCRLYGQDIHKKLVLENCENLYQEILRRSVLKKWIYEFDQIAQKRLLCDLCDIENL